MRILKALHATLSVLFGSLGILGLFVTLRGRDANEARPIWLFGSVALLAYAGTTGFGLRCATGRGPRLGSASLFLPTLAALALVLDRPWFLPAWIVLAATAPGAYLGVRGVAGTGP